MGLNSAGKRNAKSQAVIKLYSSKYLSFNLHFSKIIKPEMKPYWYPDIYPDNLVSVKRISG